MSPTETRQALAARIRQARKASGYSQERLAEALGTSRRHVIKWEKGQHAPDAEYRARLASLTGRPKRDFEEEAADEELLAAVAARVDEGAERAVA